MAEEAEFNKIGVIGLGIVGKRIADVLRREGRDVYLWNRTAKSEPNFMGSPEEVARLANLIQIYVADGTALLSVLNAMKGSLTSDHIVINHSTVEPQATVEAYKITRELGVGFLDAPFTGSKEAAANGQLVYYIGGDPALLERARSTLELTSQEILYIGKVGEATVIKIATNMISAATVEVLSEAYGLTRAAGIDPAILHQAIENNACGSVLTSMKLPSIIAGDYDPHFSLKNMFKDAKFALDLGTGFGVEMPVLSTAANVMFKTMQKGHGEKDYSVLALNFQEKKSEPEK